VAGGGIRLHNEELHNFYASPNITRLIKSRRLRWAMHVACMKEMRSPYKILVGNPEGIGVDGRIILEWEIEV
jgi:hypothetical protein